MSPVAEAPLASRQHHLTISVVTREATEFVDLTPTLVALVQTLGVREGLLTVQTLHTTTGVMINEHEPLLLGDLKAMFERLVPAGHYDHDDFERRTVNLTPDERVNGHAHCRAALLRTSESLPIVNGALTLGRWQRVFLVEFDGPRRRAVSVAVVATRGT
jgi:secondary thiamine-phosphate synthase enzyme